MLEFSYLCSRYLPNLVLIEVLQTISSQFLDLIRSIYRSCITKEQCYAHSRDSIGRPRRRRRRQQGRLTHGLIFLNLIMGISEAIVINLHLSIRYSFQKGFLRSKVYIVHGL